MCKLAQACPSQGRARLRQKRRHAQACTSLPKGSKCMLVQACIDKHAVSMPQACRKHGQACQKVPNASLRKLAKEVCTCLQQACKISLQFWFGICSQKANYGVKHVLFGHWFPQHALSSTRFQCGAGVSGTAGAELAYSLLMFIYILNCLIYVLIVSHSSYLNGNFTL